MTESALSGGAGAGTAMLALSGEIDLSTADDAAGRGIAALGAGDNELLIDMRGVTFIDSTGIAAMVRIRNAALEHGQSVALEGMQPAVRRIFELTGLLELFERQPPH